MKVLEKCGIKDGIKRSLKITREQPVVRTGMFNKVSCKAGVVFG